MSEERLAFMVCWKQNFPFAAFSENAEHCKQQAAVYSPIISLFLCSNELEAEVNFVLDDFIFGNLKEVRKT